MFTLNKSCLCFYFILICSVIDYCYSKNYCNPEFCNDSKKHVLCKFKVSGPGKNCLNYEALLKTAKDKREILDKINSRRNKVASGEIRSLPAAENMMKLEWSTELELSAQRWADQCSINGSTDNCRDLENVSVGQNIATIYGEAPGLSPASLVDMWYMELLNINSSIISRYKPRMQHYDNFTQLVWGVSKQVGCGGAKFTIYDYNKNRDENKTVYRLVCNFVPSGNLLGESVYSDGLPCSSCPSGGSCDLKYKFLCMIPSDLKMESKNEMLMTKKFPLNVFNYITLKDFSNKTNGPAKLQTTTTPNFYLERYFLTTNCNNKMSNNETLITEGTHFDFISHLLDITRSYPSTTVTTTKCKEVLAVDEFIELLKHRLRNENFLKDFLLSTTKQPETEETILDRTVDAILSQIYSKEKPLTTIKPTKPDEINSTLLVDLVEAVIFRQSDRLSTEVTKLYTNINNVSPVKIRAELGEVIPNSEFTGHYFFPEEDEENTSEETSETYYDAENLPVSEISLEIEDLKRSKEKKDFLYDILGDDFLRESVTTESILLTLKTISGEYAETIKNDSVATQKKKRAFNDQKFLKRIKRGQKNKQNHEMRFDSGAVIINYQSLLKKLAYDMRKLQLNKVYHCAYNNFGKLLFYNVNLTLYYITLYLLINNNV